MSAMAVGEPGLASKPASPAAGPTQVRLRCKDTQWQVAFRCFSVVAEAPGLCISEIHMLFDLTLVPNERN